MAASEILLNALFYLFAAVAIAGAVAVAVSRNIVRSAFALLAVLFAAAALYGIMKADFILAAQVIIYVGGILVLIIFAIMLTHKITNVEMSNESTPGPAAFFACLCLLFSLVVIVLSYPRWKREAEPFETRTVEASAPKIAVEATQYQGDGQTGIPKGGNTFDQVVVLKLAMQQVVEGVTEAEVSIYPIDRKAGPLIVGAPFEVSEESRGRRTATARAEGLPEGEYRWSFRLLGEKGEVVGWTPADRTMPVTASFVVQRGIVKPTGEALMNKYLLPFEIVSVLLLAALIGAAFLARKEIRA